MTVLVRERVACPANPADLAAWALREELLTWPKPGLVSPVDSGAHDDMDVSLFEASIEALRDYFRAIYAAGRRDAPLAELRALGLAAERQMLDATRGINTHRGAIFSLGLLLAAAGRREARIPLAGHSLGVIVRETWGTALAQVSPEAGPSNGLTVARRYGVGGARAEAANGFPSIYDIGLPALRDVPGEGWNACKVQCIFTIVAHLDDTNVLHRGGLAGLRFAQARARHFLAEGGVARPDYLQHAAEVHRAFVERRLSPGGAGDLLAATILVDFLERSSAPTFGERRDVSPQVFNRAQPAS